MNTTKYLNKYELSSLFGNVDTELFSCTDIVKTRDNTLGVFHFNRGVEDKKARMIRGVVVDLEAKRIVMWPAGMHDVPRVDKGFYEDDITFGVEGTMVHLFWYNDELFLSTSKRLYRVNSLWEEDGKVPDVLYQVNRLMGDTLKELTRTMRRDMVHSFIVSYQSTVHNRSLAFPHVYDHGAVTYIGSRFLFVTDIIASFTMSVTRNGIRDIMDTVVVGDILDDYDHTLLNIEVVYIGDDEVPEGSYDATYFDDWEINMDERTKQVVANMADDDTIMVRVFIKDVNVDTPLVELDPSKFIVEQYSPEVHETSDEEVSGWYEESDEEIQLLYYQDPSILEISRPVVDIFENNLAKSLTSSEIVHGRPNTIKAPLFSNVPIDEDTYEKFKNLDDVFFVRIGTEPEILINPTSDAISAIVSRNTNITRELVSTFFNYQTNEDGELFEDLYAVGEWLREFLNTDFDEQTLIYILNNLEQRIGFHQNVLHRFDGLLRDASRNSGITQSVSIHDLMTTSRGSSLSPDDLMNYKIWIAIWILFMRGVAPWHKVYLIDHLRRFQWMLMNGEWYDYKESTRKNVDIKVKPNIELSELDLVLLPKFPLEAYRTYITSRLGTHAKLSNHRNIISDHRPRRPQQTRGRGRGRGRQVQRRSR